MDEDHEVLIVGTRGYSRLRRVRFQPGCVAIRPRIIPMSASSNFRPCMTMMLAMPEEYHKGDG
ncbi:MAG: hypothetical protein GX608_03665 [Lentisphaerae bacterium]|nr:hypothetical protein [Lentisphaerota bacterium]